MDVRELVWAVRGAPLVLRIQEFLGWLGDQRRLSRIPLPAPQGHRRYTYVSLARGCGSGTNPGGAAYLRWARKPRCWTS